MSKKYLIFGATGSIGSSLANQLYAEKKDCHLIGRNKEEIEKLSTKLSYSYSVCDVLEVDFSNKISQKLIKRRSSAKLSKISFFFPSGHCFSFTS